MPLRARTPFLIAVVSCLPACTITTVTLPLGYHHEGAKTVAVNASEDTYLCQLAAKAVSEHVADYPGLFTLVPTSQDAELVIVAAGEQGTTARVTGGGVFGRGIFGSSSTRQDLPTTTLGIAVFTRDRKRIYENTKTLLGTPNDRMSRAAEDVLELYARGR